MSGQIIENDNATVLQFWCQLGFDVDIKGGPIHRA